MTEITSRDQIYDTVMDALNDGCKLRDALEAVSEAINDWKEQQLQAVEARERIQYLEEHYPRVEAG
jgi:hypothetical protein